MWIFFSVSYVTHELRFDYDDETDNDFTICFTDLSVHSVG